MNRGLFYGGLLILIWSWPTVFITLLSDDFDVITQNFFRYSAGSLILLLIVLVFRRREFLRARAKVYRFFIPSLLVFAFQIVWVQAIYLTTPTTSILLSKLDVIFIATLSALLFEAERRVVKNRFFIAGCSLALLGAVGVALGRGGEADAQFNLGVLLLLLRSGIWAVYTVMIRDLVNKVEPLITATWVFLFASVLFLPAVVVWGDIYRPTNVSVTTNIMLFGSGAVCVGLGNALNYTTIKHLGSTMTTTLLLVTPFTAGIIAYLVCDETLTALQVVSGVVIVSSCLLIVRKVVVHDDDK